MKKSINNANNRLQLRRQTVIKLTPVTDEWMANVVGGESVSSQATYCTHPTSYLVPGCKKL